MDPEHTDGKVTCLHQIDPVRVFGSKVMRVPRNLLHYMSEFSSLFRSGTQCPPPLYFAGDWFAKLRCGRVLL